MSEGSSGAATVTIWSDVACPWATVAVHRFVTTRSQLGLDGRVVLDHRAFPLELFNERPTPRRTLDSESRVLSDLVPDLGLGPWTGKDSEYPVTTLVCLEAVAAAKQQSLTLAESLDLALRRALFVESRCISVLSVLREVAGGVAGLDVDAVVAAISDGRHRAQVFADRDEAERRDDVNGSPQLLVGEDGWFNPGIEMHWDSAAYAPVIDADDPAVYETILRKAVG